MRLVYSRLARADLMAAQAWYSQRERALGTRCITAVAAAAKKLQRFPESAEIVHAPYFRRAVIRGFLTP